MPPGDAVPDESSADAGGGSGALRGGLRSIISRLGRTVVGALPANPKVLGKQADKISDLIDHAIHVNSERKLQSQDGSQHQRLGRWSWAAPVLFAIPSIVKSSVLGAVLFSSYEAMHDGASGGGALSPFVSSPSLVAMISGTLGGAAHGLASVTWDKTLLYGAPISVEKWSRVETMQKSVFGGTVLAHSLVHGSLFGSYHVLKKMVMTDSKRQQSPLEEAAAVVCTGGLAGTLSEIVGHYLSPIEQGHGWKAVMQLPRPAVRSIIVAAVPSGLGFFAFEFAS